MSKGPQTEEEALGRLIRRRREFLQAHAPEMQCALVAACIRALGRPETEMLRTTAGCAAEITAQLWAEIFPDEAEELKIRAEAATATEAS